MIYLLATILEMKGSLFVMSATNFWEQAVSAESAAAIFLQRLQLKASPVHWKNLSGNK